GVGGRSRGRPPRRSVAGGGRGAGPAGGGGGGGGPAVTVWGAPSRAHPAIAAVVPLGLLGQGLEELPHQLVARQALERGELLGGELGKVLRVAQPLEQLLGHVVSQAALDAP